jgi:hypothetical protein
MDISRAPELIAILNKQYRTLRLNCFTISGSVARNNQKKGKNREREHKSGHGRFIDPFQWMWRALYINPF